MMHFKVCTRRALSLCVGVLSSLLMMATSPDVQAQGFSRGSMSTLEAASIPNTDQPAWIYRSTPNAHRAIVFVHGLFGHTRDTWKNVKTGKTFFELTKESDAGREFDIFAFGFTSNFFDGGSLTPTEAAQTLRASLKSHGVEGYSSVTFVAHSMGGLVVMEYLLSNPDMAAKVPFVALYATPQEGAQIASIAKFIAKNPALPGMFPARDNIFLQQLDSRWKNMAPRRPAVVCGYEKKDTFGIRVVPWESATRFCTGPATPIQGADHLDLVKPDTSSHPSVELLRNALDDYVINPRVGERAVGIRVAFSPYPGLSKKPDMPPGLDLMLLDPRKQGPFGFRPIWSESPNKFQHSSFALPAPGKKIYGYVNRIMSFAYLNKTSSYSAIRTPICLEVTSKPLPAAGYVDLQCTEGEQCIPTTEGGPIVPCGTSAITAVNSWWNRLPISSAEAAAPMNTTPMTNPDHLEQPLEGDWIVPSLAMLRELRDTGAGRAYSEIVLNIDGLGSQEEVDRVAYEAFINGRRLWVNGNPSWADASPHVNGAQATIVLALENLSATGANRGKEELDIKINLLAGTRTVAVDSVRLDFTSLRNSGPNGVITRDGRRGTWSSTYFLAAADRYQLFAYGGGENDTLRAKRQFDSASVRIAGENFGLVTGVVRPPNRESKRWGLAIGTLLGSGQIRYSFDTSSVVEVCRALAAPGIRDSLRRAGFPDPARFGVREIATISNDEKLKPVVPCSKFS